MMSSTASSPFPAPGGEGGDGAPRLRPDWVDGIPGILRRQLRRKQSLFRAGQAMRAVFLIHAGQFKTSVLSADGREKITGFHGRGDLLGIDALGSPRYGCDAVALDVCEVRELPCAELDRLERLRPGLKGELIANLAAELRHSWHWMLSIGTLGAEQRVVAFLLDLSERQRALGFSPRQLLLRMTRDDLGSFLAIQFETVTRALSHLAAQGLITVARRQVELHDPDALRALLGSPHGRRDGIYCDGPVAVGRRSSSMRSSRARWSRR